MKKTGTHNVFNDLTLKDYTWSIESVRYNWTTSKAFIEVLMKEEGSVLTHSRTYDFDCPAVWNDQDVINTILNLEPFKGSV